ncbi:MAG: hypothetical protein A3A86_04890 [Elusimicrobia bacterium RIFCSPLOWO2_01_FULL_60_11]|nr:MAG: hypothetical protein A3A86_04890 [Elusimicrobia bacterium RIFCSPLOWO2_01_FULL_60_11]
MVGEDDFFALFSGQGRDIPREHTGLDLDIHAVRERQAILEKDLAVMVVQAGLGPGSLFGGAPDRGDDGKGRGLFDGFKDIGDTGALFGFERVHADLDQVRAEFSGLAGGVGQALGSAQGSGHQGPATQLLPDLFLRCSHRP